jgi:hypothetical protein
LCFYYSMFSFVGIHLVKPPFLKYYFMKGWSETATNGNWGLMMKGEIEGRKSGGKHEPLFDNLSMPIIENKTRQWDRERRADNQTVLKIHSGWREQVHKLDWSVFRCYPSIVSLVSRIKIFRRVQHSSSGRTLLHSYVSLPNHLMHFSLLYFTHVEVLMLSSYRGNKDFFI